MKSIAWLYIQSQHYRNEMSYALKHTGMSVRDIFSRQQLEDDLYRSWPDIIIFEDDELNNLTNVIKRIRQGEICDNRFIPVLALTRNTSAFNISKMANSGIDDIVIYPASRKEVLDRIRIITKNRKKFVSTPFYIGPNRRADARSNTKRDMLYTVPNSLSEKLAGTYDPHLFKALINQTEAKTNKYLNENNKQLLARIVKAANICPTHENSDSVNSLKTLMSGLTLSNGFSTDIISIANTFTSKGESKGVWDISLLKEAIATEKKRLSGPDVLTVSKT